jgi:threonine dehydrogenase-like Zn-dependent dehydrogenase
MRRFLLGAIATLATVALVTPSWATTTITETVPRRIEAPIEKACPFEVTATDRSEQTARSTNDDARTLLTRTISGRQLTLFERSEGHQVVIESLGTVTITRRSDGTYSYMHRGTGVWFDDGSLSGTAELLRFTGTVRAVGVYDASTYTFQPMRRTIGGVTASICEMLVSGLKTRH